MKVIARGAEATIEEGVWHGRKVVVKRRLEKTYRAKELDQSLRAARTKSEALLMTQARRSGVRTPLIYDIDLKGCSIVMEFIEGQTAKALLQESAQRESLATLIGAGVGRLHKANIVHGDLTTSNIIFPDAGTPCFVDFGLGEKSQELEKKGVDMHLLKEALGSAHSHFPGLYDCVVSAYLKEYKEGKPVLRIVEEIQKRGRYT
jgi:Kae1-associated kinase Bud32